MDGKLRVLAAWTVLLALSTVISSFPKGQLLSLQIQQDSERQPAEFAAWTFCFQRLCTCKDDVADCSQNHGRLTFIPKFPESVKFVNFSFNNVSKIPAQFFVNVTDIRVLDLSSNDLSMINVHAFELVGNLTGLYIGGNPELSYKALDPVFSIPTLETLDITGGSLGPLPTKFFLKHPLPNVQRLNLYGNYLTLNDLTNFSSLGSLVELNLGYNDIAAINTQVTLNVRIVRLEKNIVSRFPVTCKNGTSLYPALTRLVLTQNKIDKLATEVCLPALRYLDLGQNSISSLLKDGFRDQLFPSLTELYLDSMTAGITSIEMSAFNNPALEILSLSNDKLGFDYEVNSDAFQGCSRLKALFLDNNSYLISSQEKAKKIFRFLSNLRRLSLINVEAMSPYTGLLSELTYLSHLSLSGNWIYDIPDGAFDEMSNLVSLDLSKNSLSTVQETIFNASTRQKWKHLDFSGNPFTCSCGLRWLQAWLKENPGLFSNPVSNYNCTCYGCDSEYTGDIRRTFYLSEQACLLSQQSYSALVAFSMLALIAQLTILYCLRKRYRVRKMIRRALVGDNDNRQQELVGQARYEYDLFVAYAEEDEDWIRGSLIPQLEGRRGLRLCIHTRDFHPGRQILESIENCVEVSRRILVVFSPHFARSDWCQFELTLCQRHAMDRGQYLLVVLLRGVPERELTPGMTAILRTYTYLLWSERPRDAAPFWNTMGLVLNDDV